MKILIDLERRIKPNPEARRTCFHTPGAVRRVVLPNGTLQESRDIQTVHTLFPQPEYLFEFQKDISIVCFACGLPVLLKDLESDSDDEGGYSDAICPHCKVWECFIEPLVYETIKDALLRKESLEAPRTTE